MADAKAASINVRDLSAAVDRAVTEILAGQKLEAAQGLAIGPGTLVGRQLRGTVTDLAAVQKAAADVTAQVQRSIGGARSKALSPAALFRDGHIIVGFIAEGMFEASFQ